MSSSAPFLFGELLSKVPFCWNLSTDDLILICCRMQAQKFGVAQAQESQKNSSAGEVSDTYIMREGDVGDEMFIITEGVVRIERHESGQPLMFASDSTGQKDLGRLRQLDFFGELAVLTAQENGEPFPRTRSAVCALNTCVVQSLSYASLQELRKQSSTMMQL